MMVNNWVVGREDVVFFFRGYCSIFVGVVNIGV